MQTLYTMQKDKVREWSVWTEGSTVVVEHGQVDGKKTQKKYEAEPKNVGRANETTAAEQALLEAEAKYVKQLKSGYSKTVEEAKAFTPFFPMKAQNYNDQSHKIVYPCIIQPKLDGQRLMIDKEGNAWSKQGEPLKLPNHWRNVKELAIRYGGLDGEVYSGLKHKGGLSLQKIISAFRKPNEDTHKLQYWVYDIPDKNLNQGDRYQLLMELEMEVGDHDIKDVVVSAGIYIEDEEEGDIEHASIVEEKYEGSCYRNVDGMYEFDKRSYNLIKRKDRLDAEALVLSYELDKNDEPVYIVRAVNGDQTGAEFKLKMKIPDGVIVSGRNYRNKANADRLLGLHINYQYEDLSDTEDGLVGVPLKPVGISVREVINGEGRY